MANLESYSYGPGRCKSHACLTDGEFSINQYILIFFCTAQIYIIYFNCLGTVGQGTGKWAVIQFIGRDL